MLNTIDLYYFSPTGGTKKVGKYFSEALSEKIKEVDLGKQEECVAPSGDVVVVAAPVFAGRIPALVTEKLMKLDGNGKKTVVLAVYGNRAYDDALLELTTVMKERGFQVIAAGAFIAQHSIVPEVASGRPDEKDVSEIHDFAKQVLNKIEKKEEGAIEVPGNYPYREGSNTSASPISLSSCGQCGKCAAVCPTGALQIENGSVVTSLEKCILCMACVSACPQQARVLPAPLKEGMKQKLGALKDVRRKNEMFF